MTEEMPNKIRKDLAPFQDMIQPNMEPARTVPKTFDYPAFLAARLDEQEGWVRDSRESGYAETLEDYAFVLADIAAKRAILDKYAKAVAYLKSLGRYNDNGPEALAIVEELNDVVRVLCRPFADHPEYPGCDE